MPLLLSIPQDYAQRLYAVEHSDRSDATSPEAPLCGRCTCSQTKRVISGVAMGAAVTQAVTRAASWTASRFGEDGGAQILITLLIPFGVYLLAESFHCSGILAAVAAGVTMSVTDVWQWRATTRLRRTAVWDIVQFAANGSIFVLLGEQIPVLVSAAPLTVQSTPHQNPWWLILYVVVIEFILAMLRFAWVWATLRAMIFSARRRGAVPPASGWRMVLAPTLAGVRGAVTLAGVLTLPLVTGDGIAFPAPALSIRLATGVIVLSLFLATIAWPRTLQGLDLTLEPSNKAGEDRARVAAAKIAVVAVEAAETETAKGQADGYRYADAATKVVYLYRKRIDLPGDKDGHTVTGTDDEIERRLLLVGLRAEREALLGTGRDGSIDETARCAALYASWTCRRPAMSAERVAALPDVMVHCTVCEFVMTAVMSF